MISFFTPAMIFLKAKFKKASLIYSVNRGQSGQFTVGTSKHQGIMDVKGVGPFIVTENSHTIEKKSKTPFYFAFGEFATTIPLEFAQTVQNLREAGKKVTNVEDLARFVGLRFNNITKVWEQIPEKELDKGISIRPIAKMLGRAKLPSTIIPGLPEGTREQTQNLLNNEFVSKIEPYKSIKIHELAYMFPFNITPALVESKIQHMIGLKMHMFNKMNMQYVLMFIMILMGATLAVVIATKFINTGDTTGVTETKTIIERVVQQVPIANMTG